MYLVRHGATDNNLANPPILQGRNADVPLSDKGFEQVRRTAEFLAPLPIDAVYSSPLLRAQQTAQFIAEKHDCPTDQIDEIMEVDVGQWEGLSWDEIERSEPDRYHRFMSDPVEHGYKNGESFSDVSHRVMPAMEKICAENLGRTIVVAAHNIVNRVFLANVIKLPLREARRLTQKNCGINHIRLHSGELQLMTMNLTVHLGPLEK